MEAVKLCFDLDQTKSPADKKHYRLLQLANGCRVLLVHDPDQEGREVANNDDCSESEQRTAS